jgi:hypothetical protein
MDGVQWNGSSFICGINVDDGTTPADEDIYDHTTDIDEARPESATDKEQMTVFLVDIARPAKPKGIPGILNESERV